MILNIEKRLEQELKFRSTHLILPHIAFICVTYFILSRMPFYSAYILMIVSILLRRTFFNNKFLFLTCVAGSGLGWGLLLSDVYSYFGLYSMETLYCLGCIIILMSAGITVFSCSLVATWIFQISLSVIPIYLLLSDSAPSIYILGILLIFNIAYQFYHAYLSHHFLRKSLANEIKVSSQNRTLQEFMNAIPGLVAVINHDHEFVMVNNQFDGAYKNIVGKKVENFFPDSEITKVLIDFFKGHKENEVCEIKSWDSGVENWYMVNLSRISAPENGIIAAILPITDLVKAKNDLKIQETRSLYAAKLASLGELSAGIAHEVNNPLTIIEGAASLMKVLLNDKEIDRPALMNVSVKITDTTQRIARIIKSLRTLSVKAEEDPYKNVLFYSILEPSLEISKGLLVSHHIEMRVFKPEVDVELFGNEIQLSQVVMNLITNAIDAVKDCPAERWIEVHYRPSQEWLDILIIDNGSGVALENRGKIMEAFFTTKDGYKGTGLGLSISKSIVDSHHGTLELLQDEKHTTFRMRFPRMNPWQDSKKIDQSEGPIAVPE